MTTDEFQYPLLCEMMIMDCIDNYYLIEISCQSEKTSILYKPAGRFLKYVNDEILAGVLIENEYQLRKILHNKKPDTFYPGFNLKFIIRNNNECIQLNDLSKLVVYDKRTSIPGISTLDYYECDFISMFTDGSYDRSQEKCSFVVLFKNRSGLYNIRFGIKEIKNSSLIELMAVIEGLNILKNEPKIRIVTDSRYVIKGLTEWIYNWKLNDWNTAQGVKVKHISQWLEYDALTENKYIEFDWVKGHSFHYENTICDRYAKELLSRNKTLNVKKYSFKKGFD